MPAHPGSKERRFMVKKLVTYLALAGLILFVVFHPGSAGAVLRELGQVAVNVLVGVNDFFARLVS
jgi:hypothetical protein